MVNVTTQPNSWQTQYFSLGFDDDDGVRLCRDLGVGNKRWGARVAGLADCPDHCND